MRPIVIHSLLAASALFSLHAQAAEQTRTVAPFSAVSNAGPISISIDVGKTQSVTASGSDRFLSELTTEVVDGELRIRLKDKGISDTWGDPKVVITVPQLTRFVMAGAGDTKISNVSGDRLEIEFGGAGSLKADGNVKTLKIDVGGVGSFDAKALHAETALVNVGGVGSVKVYASTRLDASVGGVGSLIYYGDPKTVNTSGGGLGSISRGK